ncbi:PD-(D/E)XK nuclease family protein [Pleionea sediminis]|uniref:PD-(D/E)XK nuclease family protein n=1 Tax=Pleionea sediminis TaxID=2569479 RepID=UPI0011861417|nr:PD-(D/E)XK nuclease family protein [Pleionea sediminis]
MKLDHPLRKKLKTEIVTVITASNRQARYWTEQYHSMQSSQHQVWSSPDILPVGAFLNRVFDELSMSIETPVLFNSQQGFILWQQIVQQSDIATHLISVNSTARKAYEAYQTLLRWNVSLDDINVETEDHSAFISWARTYETMLNSDSAIDIAGLCQWLDFNLETVSIEELQSIKLPIVFTGFHQMDPALNRLIERLKNKGCVIDELEITETPNASVAFQTNDFESEMVLAADWCKEQLKTTSRKRLAVIIPELDKRRYQVEDIFRRQLHPDQLSQIDDCNLSYNISVGVPALHYPLMRTALNLIKLLGLALKQDELAELLKSSCLGRWHTIGGEDFIWQLKRSAFRIHETDKDEWKLQSVIVLLEKESRSLNSESTSNKLTQFKSIISNFNSLMSQSKTPEQWSEIFWDWLELWQWPGKETLSSYLFQQKTQFIGLLQQLKQYNIINKKVSLSTAFSWFQSIIEQATFQPKSKGEPIQVMGLYEAIGQSFDAVWLSGMSNNSLPETPDPNPFIPLSFARQHSMPGSSPDKELEYATSLIKQLLKVSDYTVVSYYSQEGEESFSPTSILNDYITNWELKSSEQKSIFPVMALEEEEFNDETGLPMTESKLIGGAQFLQSQALCPMQGYLSYRLGLEEQEEANLGIDPRERGIYVHEVMQFIWQQLGSQNKLISFNDDDLFELINDAIESCSRQVTTNSSLIAAIEKEKYTHLIFELLQLEKKREPFNVKALEFEQEIVINGVSIKTRLDRLDELENGSQIVIDYKTGRVDAQKWFGERIAEPQMPIYLMTEKEKIRALCFAQLHHSGVKFSGVSEHDKVLPGVKSIEKVRAPVDSWRDFIHQIETSIFNLVEEIKLGLASVTPEHRLRACDFCPFDSVCRIAEIEAGSSSFEEMN